MEDGREVQEESVPVCLKPVHHVEEAGQPDDVENHTQQGDQRHQDLSKVCLRVLGFSSVTAADTLFKSVMLFICYCC